MCESASLYVGGGECVCVSGGCGVYMCVSLSLCGGYTYEREPVSVCVCGR